MKAIVFMMIILLCCSASGFADTLKDEDDVARFADQVVETVVVEGVVAAFDKMKPYVHLDEATVNSLATQSKEQRDQLAERFGKSVGYEFIGKKKVGTSLVQLQYIEKAERHLFPWTFYFYRTEQGWMLADFYWHGDVKKFFAEQTSTCPVEEPK
jgi:hypothetical protein